jgi:hypothetical protein
VDRYRAGSPALAGRLAALAPSFPACRPVTGDGNCFYRGFLFALLEALLEAPLLELHARWVFRAPSPNFTSLGEGSILFSSPFSGSLASAMKLGKP